jgi:hypothetical protein
MEVESDDLIIDEIN